MLCTCGAAMCEQADHEQMKQKAIWHGLRWVGIQELPGMRLVMRDCPLCHSTLCKLIDDKKDEG